MILDTIKERVGRLKADRVCLRDEIADLEKAWEAAVKTLADTDDELGLCERLLKAANVVEPLPTVTPVAIAATVEAKPDRRASIASDCYANPDVMTLRWKNGELEGVVLHIMQREPERWFRQRDIINEIAKQHKRVAHTSSVATIILKACRSSEVVARHQHGAHTTYKLSTGRVG